MDSKIGFCPNFDVTVRRYVPQMRLPFDALLLATLGWEVSLQDGSVGAIVAAVRSATRAGRPDYR